MSSLKQPGTAFLTVILAALNLPACAAGVESNEPKDGIVGEAASAVSVGADVHFAKVSLPYARTDGEEAAYFWINHVSGPSHSATTKFVSVRPLAAMCADSFSVYRQCPNSNPAKTNWRTIVVFTKGKGTETDVTKGSGGFVSIQAYDNTIFAIQAPSGSLLHSNQNCTLWGVARFTGKGEIRTEMSEGDSDVSGSLTQWNNWTSGEQYTWVLAVSPNSWSADVNGPTTCFGNGCAWGKNPDGTVWSTGTWYTRVTHDGVVNGTFSWVQGNL